MSWRTLFELGYSGVPHNLVYDHLHRDHRAPRISHPLDADAPVILSSGAYTVLKEEDIIPPPQSLQSSLAYTDMRLYPSQDQTLRFQLGEVLLEFS